MQKEAIRVNWKIVCVFAFLTCLLSLIFYIYQINFLTKSAYSISSYENQIKTISQENKNLEIGFAENSFLGEVFAKVQSLNFQKITSVKYIQIPDNLVAKN